MGTHPDLHLVLTPSKIAFLFLLVYQTTTAFGCRGSGRTTKTEVYTCIVLAHIFFPAAVDTLASINAEDRRFLEQIDNMLTAFCRYRNPR